MYKVLLVDDEPFAIEGLQLLIDWEKHGFEIGGVCANGEEAIDVICTAQPDLVVTDIRMPVMSGLELIEEARRRGHDSTLFVITSGYSDFNYARQAIRLGVSNYLTKPVVGPEADDMLERLRQELQERETLERIREQAKEHRIRRILTELVMGTELADGQEKTWLISEMSERANQWTYVQIMFEGEASSHARSVLQQIAEKKSCCYLIDSGRTTCGIVWGEAHFEATGVTSSLRAFAEEALASVQKEDSAEVKMAVGLPVHELDELPVSYSSAVEAGRFLFFSESSVMFAEDIEEQPLLFDPGTLMEADDIMEQLENGSTEELSVSVRRAFNRFKQDMAAPELIDIFSTQILFRALALCKELGGEPNTLIQESALQMSRRQHRNIEESASMLEEFCLKCQSAVMTLRQKQVGGTQAMVAEYLRSHYKETFTIRELAEQFYINPVHLGQSFTRKYGKGVLDVVHDLRMEEAKKLLRETEQTSCAIAEEVGYRSYQYFLKQFEKRLGMKPAEYRQQSVT
ncbi:response regulator transcription factor [Paenibacillus pabuli]|uniref:response regulator transcription factor n=1 Tax=Paenibacillus pabuli TaxID=1472 RepID=UPI003CFA45DD